MSPPAEPVAAPPAARPSRLLLGGVAAFVVAVAAIGYWTHGRPDALAGAPVMPPAAADGGSMAQIEGMVAKLADRLKVQPEDAEGWMMLGRSYSVLQRYGEAVEALQKARRLRPDDANVLADLADAIAMRSGRKLAGEPEQLLARALELEPRNLKALALAGTAAFERGDFPTAVREWQVALEIAEPGSELMQGLQSGIAEARTRGGLAPAAPAASGAPVVAAAAAPAASAAVAGRVTLAAALQGRVAPEDTVFVFARAAEGPRMPLAILRRQVKDLPVDFRLDDSMAMNPALSLSSVPRVVVGARISKSGQAIAQPGDLQGYTEPVAVGAQDLRIEIGERVK